MNILILDVNNFVYRSHHGLPPLIDAHGRNMAAAHGFMTKLLELTAHDFKDWGVIAVLDHTGPTFRDDLWPTYKEHRMRPAELDIQFGLVEQFLGDLGIHTFKVPGVEADDVIATLAAEFGGRLDFGETVIATTDKDLMQVVDADNYVTLWDPWQHKRIYSGQVQDKFGVLPHQVAMVQALAGDGTDGIPGVPKIGIKTAAKMVGEYLTFGNMFESLNNKGKLSVVENNVVAAGREYIDTMFKLTLLKDDVPEVIEYMHALVNNNQMFPPKWHNAAHRAEAEGLKEVARRLVER